MKGSKCRECGFPIVFVLMVSGKRLPVDPAPDSRGNVTALKVHGRYTDGHHADPRPGTPLGRVRLMPHFATCAARLPKARPRPADQPLPI